MIRILNKLAKSNGERRNCMKNYLRLHYGKMQLTGTDEVFHYLTFDAFAKWSQLWRQMNLLPFIRFYRQLKALLCLTRGLLVVTLFEGRERLEFLWHWWFPSWNVKQTPKGTLQMVRCVKWEHFCTSLLCHHLWASRCFFLRGRWPPPANLAAINLGNNLPTISHF